MEEFEVTTADMLEIVAGGGNGVEYVDIVGLMEKAAKELREKYAEIERLREALREAIDEVETWGGSTSPFLQEKHDLEGTLAELRTAIGEGK